MADVITRHESVAKDYKRYSEIELILAANSPVPLITNPMREPFMEYLTHDLNLHEWHATEICHDLWFFEMHKEDEGFEDDPGKFFREVVLYDYDASDAIFRKGMRMLDDYLNNLPHWQLKGHTPTEALDMLNMEERSVDIGLLCPSLLKRSPDVTTLAHAVVVRNTRTVVEEGTKDEGYGSIYREEV